MATFSAPVWLLPSVLAGVCPDGHSLAHEREHERLVCLQWAADQFSSSHRARHVGTLLPFRADPGRPHQIQRSRSSGAHHRLTIPCFSELRPQCCSALAGRSQSALGVVLRSLMCIEHIPDGPYSTATHNKVRETRWQRICDDTDRESIGRGVIRHKAEPAVLPILG